MPRLPQPTLALKGHRGRLLEPLTLTGPAGLRPTSYRPVTQRVLRPAMKPGLTDTATSVPAGCLRCWTQGSSIPPDQDVRRQNAVRTAH